MPTRIHSLGENDLENQECFRDVYEGVYLHGECFSFALAIHREFGWQMIALFADESRSYGHVGVRSPEGRIFDIRGFVTEEEFGAIISLKPPFDLIGVTESDLNEIEPPSEYNIQRAHLVAEVLFPDLPWKETRISRIIAFTNELEELSRKYGLWIRSPLPNPSCYPPLSFGEGDEGGYELYPTPAVDGLSFVISRYLCR